MEQTIRLMPAKGVYTQANTPLGSFSVHLYNQAEPERIGTDVQRDAAIYLLTRRPSIVNVAPVVGKDGKIVQQLSSKEAELVEAVQRSNFNSESSFIKAKASDQDLSNSVDVNAIKSSFAKEVAERDAKIAVQAEQIGKLTVAVQSLMDKVSDLKPAKVEK